MTQNLTPARQQRFRKLLTLAAESPFAGERDAALAAAERLAATAGMDLEEAARACGRADAEAAEAAAAGPSPSRRAAAARAGLGEDWPGAGSGPWTDDLGPAARRGAWTAYAWEAAASRARQRHREEVARRQREEEAQRREERGRRGGGQPRSARSMPRRDFARLLLLETDLPLRDIADTTELSLYEVVTLKLKLRPEIAQVRARRAAFAERRAKTPSPAPRARRAAGFGAR